MNIFTKIGEVIDGPTVWHDDLGGMSGLAADLSVCSRPWCGEHIVTETGVTHLRRVAGAYRPDGDLLLAVTLQQQEARDHLWRPMVHIAPTYLDMGEDEDSIVVRAEDAEIYVPLWCYRDEHGERLAQAVMMASDLLLARVARERLAAGVLAHA